MRKGLQTSILPTVLRAALSGHTPDRSVRVPHTERLKELRRVIEAAPEDRLHMGAWSEKGKCGTAYCAGGWAAVDPWFQEHTEIGEIFRVEDDGLVKVAGYWNPFTSLAYLFEITDEESEHLFGAGLEDKDPHAVTKAEVLANIDGLLSGGSTVKYAAAEEVGDEDDWDDDYGDEDD